MSSSLAHALQDFTDPQSEAQLQFLDATVQAIETASCAQADLQALFGVFERFPEEDGYGVFWGILHALEACDGYESELLASVQRQPCEFNVLMVNRLLNAEVSEVEGHALEDVLRDVVLHPKATGQAVHDAKHYLVRRGA
ncbi:MAG: hypothetical protein QM777_04975 [Pseudorhodoferax sp.]